MSSFTQYLLLNAVTNTTTGASFANNSSSSFLFQLTGSAITSGATVLTQGSLDNVNWITINTTTISSTLSGTGVSFTITAPWTYLRGWVSARTDGTYTLNAIGSG